MNSKVEILDKSILSQICFNGEPEVIIDKVGFGEGPLWHPDGYLLFSDLVRNNIYKWQNNELEVYLEKSGCSPEEIDLSMTCDQIGSNGLCIDKKGTLFFCCHGAHAIATFEKEKGIKHLVSHHKDIPLNGPNDLIIAPDGSIIFSDPPYGLKEQKLNPDFFQKFSGVYRWYQEELTLLYKEFNYPNGLCFSPDFNYLYLSSAHESDKSVIRFEYKDNVLKNPIHFAPENADGIKCDKHGNLYLSTMKGIAIYSAKGTKRVMITIPSMTTNICLAPDALYITTPQKIYRQYFSYV
jgi:sugar lactone lactonase YvrE